MFSQIKDLIQKTNRSIKKSPWRITTPTECPWCHLFCALRMKIYSVLGLFISSTNQYHQSPEHAITKTGGEKWSAHPKIHKEDFIWFKSVLLLIILKELSNNAHRIVIIGWKISMERWQEEKRLSFAIKSSMGTLQKLSCKRNTCGNTKWHICYSLDRKMPSKTYQTIYRPD